MVKQPGMEKIKNKDTFSSYQKGVIALLALVQFTMVLDFMVMAPLGDLLMKSMDLRATEFASAVSAYAFSAGISGLAAAGFADKYDRKKLLLFFYVGFMAGTLLCATANSYEWLLTGRIVTGLFGGVLGAVSMAIVADLFSFGQRGRVMGVVQMALAVSQVAGIPIGLYLANSWGWQAPFFMIVGLSFCVGLVIFQWLKPITEHLQAKPVTNPLVHFKKTMVNRSFFLPFLATALLSIGGFMMMPFSTAFIINNVGVSQHDLPLVYVVTGIGSMIFLPLIGKLSDKVGKFPTFIGGTVLSIIMVSIYVNLTPVPIWEVMIISTVMFAGIMSRMIPSTALMSAIPKPEDRGAFMSVNSSLQQVAGGIAAIIAGYIIVRGSSGKLLHFDTLGYVVIAVMIVCVFLIHKINSRIAKKMQLHEPQLNEVVA